MKKKTMKRNFSGESFRIACASELKMQIRCRLIRLASDLLTLWLVRNIEIHFSSEISDLIGEKGRNFQVLVDFNQFSSFLKGFCTLMDF